MPPLTPNASIAAPVTAPRLPTKDELNAYLGKDIKVICPNHYDKSTDNHCAHFVSHALGLEFGYTCRDQTGGKGRPANLRVYQVFAHCLEVGGWAAKPASLSCCLVFVTRVDGVKPKDKYMPNIPAKHIGVYLDGTIWHYSNTKDQVVTQVPEQFQHHYPGKGFGMFYGKYR